MRVSSAQLPKLSTLILRFSYNYDHGWTQALLIPKVPKDSKDFQLGHGTSDRRVPSRRF